jgi:hypothetical protein
VAYERPEGSITICLSEQSKAAARVGVDGLVDDSFVVLMETVESDPVPSPALHATKSTPTSTARLMDRLVGRGKCVFLVYLVERL